MFTEVRLVNEMREEAIHEVQMNRLAKAAKSSRAHKTRDSRSLVAGFARELKLDFFRLLSVFGVTKASKRKGRS